MSIERPGSPDALELKPLNLETVTLPDLGAIEPINLESLELPHLTKPLEDLKLDDPLRGIKLQDIGEIELTPPELDLTDPLKKASSTGKAG